MGRRLLYTSASFSRQADFASQKSCICAVTHITKSACPTAAEKCLPTAICPYSRWRRQPLSSASRKQRYNTLDFPTENRVPTGMLAPLLETQRQRGFSPLNSPYFLCSEYPNCKYAVWNACSENAKGRSAITTILSNGTPSFYCLAVLGNALSTCPISALIFAASIPKRAL